MHYTPKPNRLPAIAVTMALVLSSFIFLGFSATVGGIKTHILKAVALAIFTAAVFTASRFLLHSYTYIFDDFEFIVVRCTGKQARTLCRLSYSDIVSTSTKKPQKAQSQGSKTYSYCVTMLASNKIYLSYDMGDEKGTVILEGNKDLEAAINKYTFSGILDE